jgi:hypothetical protein
MTSASLFPIDDDVLNLIAEDLLWQMDWEGTHTLRAAAKTAFIAMGSTSKALRTLLFGMMFRKFVWKPRLFTVPAGIWQYFR